MYVFSFLFFTRWPACWAYTCSGSLPLDFCFIVCIVLLYMLVANRVLSLRVSLRTKMSYLYVVQVAYRLTSEAKWSTNCNGQFTGTLWYYECFALRHKSDRLLHLTERLSHSISLNEGLPLMGRRWVDVSCIIARGPSAVFATECIVEYRPAATVSAVKTRRVVRSSGIAPCGAVMVPAVIDLTSFSVRCSCVAREKFPRRS